MSKKKAAFSRQFFEILSPYEHIIWDWNGTILDDLHLVVNILGDVMEQKGLPRPSPENYRNIFQFPVQKYYEQLGVQFTKHFTFQELSNHFHKTYNDRIHEAQIFEGMAELFESLSPTKTHSILSAAPQDHLQKIVREVGLNKYFTHIFGLPDNLAHSKIQRGVQLMQIANIPPDKTLLIGDTDHDYEVGQHLGVQVLLIGDGHQSISRLKKVHSQVLSSKYIENPSTETHNENFVV